MRTEAAAAAAAGQRCAGISSSSSSRVGSLPVTRGSAVDSELEQLMRAHPQKTRELLYDLHNIGPQSNRPGQEGTLKVSKQGRVGRTHYQDTYVPKASRKRSSKRPPHDEPIADSRTQGFYETSQRAEFVPKDLAAARNDPVRNKSEKGFGAAELQKLQLQGQEQQQQRTVYQEEFKERQLESNSARAEAAAAAANRPSQLLVAGGKFQSETTSKAAFKGWATGRNKLHYGELPVFMGSVLNPGNQRELQSMTQAAYTGPRGAPAAAALPATGNISLEGSFDFMTVNKDAYRPMPPNSYRQPAIRRNNETVVEKKVPMNGETQTRADFRGHDAVKFRRPEPAAQPLDNVDLRYDGKGYYGTEQRQEFQGFDVRQHPVPASFKKDPSVYTRPEGNMEMETTTQNAFQPKEIAQAYRERVKPPEATTRFAGKFSGDTTNKEAYCSFESPPSPRVRHGDFHMAYHQTVPKLLHLEGQSETKEVYVPKPLHATASFKPQQEALAAEGDHDFSTVHRSAYKQPKFRLTRDQAAAVKAELLRLDGIRRKQGADAGAAGGPLPKIASC